jgi:hypothetical protein
MLDCRCRPAKPCCCWVKKSIKRQKLTINVDPRGQTITILSKPSSMYKTNTPIVQKVCPNVFGTILVANPPRVIQPGSDESKKSSKQKKSLISMLKKLDVKLLNVLDKNKNLLKDSEVKQLSQEKPITEECTLQPKGLASRRYKKSRRQLSLGSFSRKSIAQSSKEKTPSKTSCSIVQLDLTQVSSRLRPKQYLAQSNYNSTFVLPNCEREQHQMEKKLPVKRSNLSATLNNLKRIGRSETMKKIAVGSGSPLSINRGSQKDFQKCGKR